MPSIQVSLLSTDASHVPNTMRIRAKTAYTFILNAVPDHGLKDLLHILCNLAIYFETEYDQVLDWVIRWIQQGYHGRQDKRKVELQIGVILIDELFHYLDRL